LMIVVDDFHFRCKIFFLLHYPIPKISGWLVRC
jgi:hypothetical protein